MDTLLVRLADSVSRADTLEELTRPLLELLEAVTGLESTYLTRIDLGAGIQQVLYARNTRELEIPEGLTVPWEDTLCKRALEEGRAYTDDVGTCWGDSDAARALGIQTYLSTPVRVGDGELFGTLCAASGSRAPMGADVERVLAMFSKLIGRHVERERLLLELRDLNERLAQSACTDAATGLPNRRALFDELPRMLARCRRDASGLAAAFIDLDGLKAVNDAHGHDAGDRLLEHVAHSILSTRRAGDFVARLGGDEFVVLAPVSAASAPRAVDALRAGLVAATRGRVQLDDGVLEYGGASVGVVLADVAHDDAAALLARADEAMYAEKRERRTYMAKPG